MDVSGVGLVVGVLLVVEKFLFRDRLPGWLMRIWTLAAVINGWVVFRSETIGGAWRYWRAMYAGNGSAGAALPELTSWSHLAVIAAGTLLALPWTGRVLDGRSIWSRALSLVILGFAAAALARGTYNPFLYFRF